MTVRPSDISTAPVTTISSPTTNRRRSVASGSATSSRSAAIGAIREARMAGRIDAIAVTTSPTPYDQATVDQVTGNSARLRSRPNWPNSQRSPRASR